MLSVVVPTRGSSAELEECLRSLRKQTYKNFEIIIVAEKKDAATAAKKHGARVVYDRLSTIGNAYAVGAENSRGEIVAFIDDDAYAPSDWLAKIAGEFKDGTDVVGGEDILPPGSTKFQEAAYQTDLARKLEKPVEGNDARKRLRAANIAFRKEVFSRHNFNKKLKGLQEPELLHRLAEAGLRMKFAPRIYVYHRRRNSLGGIFNQIYRNGKAKIVLLELHGVNLLSPEDAFPFVYIAAAGLFAYLSFWYLLYLIAMTTIYFLMKPLVIVHKTKRYDLYWLLYKIVVAREVAYGLGILSGIKNIFRGRKK